ncbi:MAG TPA: MMPL family transporter, partial [Chloroflexota bacterium]|nr:MMPL family transporter [Chloroflexota bacterium]
MFHALGSFAYRRRWAIIALWILVILAGTPLVPGATERLQFGGFTSPRMESVRAQELMRRELPVRGSSLVVLFTSPTLTADDPEFNRQVAYAMAGLQGAPEVDQVIPYSSNPRQISGDRRTVYELVVLKASDEEAAREIGAVTARLRDPGEASVGRPELTTEPQRAQRGPAEADRVFGDVGKGLVPFRTVAADGGSSGTSPDATPVRRTVSAETPGGGAQGPALQSAGGSQVRMLVTGGPVLFSEVERLSAEDLRRAEIVAFPFAALALLAVFGSIVATGLPIALGGASVVGILAAVALMSRAMDLSIFVVNVATMLGLGLGVDYSLFMVSRFR